jgi:hypothetical protein
MPDMPEYYVMPGVGIVTHAEDDRFYDDEGMPVDVDEDTVLVKADGEEFRLGDWFDFEDDDDFDLDPDDFIEDDALEEAAEAVREATETAQETLEAQREAAEAELDAIEEMRDEKLEAAQAAEEWQAAQAEARVRDEEALEADFEDELRDLEDRTAHPFTNAEADTHFEEYKRMRRQDPTKNLVDVMNEHLTRTGEYLPDTVRDGQARRERMAALMDETDELERVKEENRRLDGEDRAPIPLDNSGGERDRELARRQALADAMEEEEELAAERDKDAA